MMGMSKWAMGGALAVALCLILVFALLLVLLLELCCSLHRGRRPPPTLLPTTMASTCSPSSKHGGEDDQKPVIATNIAAFYAHGVLRPPPSDFLLAIPRGEAPEKFVEEYEMEKGFGACRRLPDRGKNSVHLIGLVSPPSISCEEEEGSVTGDGGGRLSIGGSEHFFCISNPMYDGVGDEVGHDGDDGGDSGGTTPFETPDTSPSRLEEEEEEVEKGSDCSPPLTLMKKLPTFLPAGCSSTACFADGRRSLGTSISVTDTTTRPSSSSSSSSNSLCSSPSW